MKTEGVHSNKDSNSVQAVARRRTVRRVLLATMLGVLLAPLVIWIHGVRAGQPRSLFEVFQLIVLFGCFIWSSLPISSAQKFRREHPLSLRILRVCVLIVLVLLAIP